MKSYTLYTILFSVIVVTANFIRQDFSFFKEKSFIVSNSYEEILLQDGFNRDVNSIVPKILKNDETFFLFPNIIRFTNPLGSIFNYLGFELFFLAS